MKLNKVYEICFRYNKIRMFATLERQTMGVNMEAHSCKKTCVITVKTAAQFFLKKKYAIVFASTQLRITRLH